MRKIYVVALMVACRTPYQPMGLTGGYEDRTLANGDILVTVKVNGHTDRGTALEYLHRRADELCPGGYDIVDRSGGDNGGLVVTRSFASESHKPEENAVIRCKAARPAVAKNWCDSKDPDRCFDTKDICTYITERECHEKGAKPVEIAPIVTPRGFYCVTGAVPEVGFCNREKDRCVTNREKVADGFSECTLTESAWCVSVDAAQACAPTIEACTARRARQFEAAATTGAKVGACKEER